MGREVRCPACHHFLHPRGRRQDDAHQGAPRHIRTGGDHAARPWVAQGWLLLLLGRPSSRVARRSLSASPPSRPSPRAPCSSPSFSSIAHSGQCPRGITCLVRQSHGGQGLGLGLRLGLELALGLRARQWALLKRAPCPARHRRCRPPLERAIWPSGVVDGPSTLDSFGGGGGGGGGGGRTCAYAGRAHRLLQLLP